MVLANSPSLAPRPVKSKRSTATPCSVSAWAILLAAKTSLPQVKQCANSATARIAPRPPCGASKRAASIWPSAPGNSVRCIILSGSLGWQAHHARRLFRSCFIRPAQTPASSQRLSMHNSTPPLPSCSSTFSKSSIAVQVLQDQPMEKLPFCIPRSLNRYLLTKLRAFVE